MTIFISMVMMCIFALLCCLVESARTAGARWYLQTAASSALDSIFSQYHRQMWDSYRLLFAEYDKEDEFKEDYTKFLTPYLDEGKWFPMELKSLEVEEWHKATDDNGSYFEKEIMDYMKYGIWNLDFEASTVEELMDTAKEANAVNDISEEYRDHADEALELEKTLESISDNLKEQEEVKKAALSELKDYDGPGFRKKAKKLIRIIKKVPGLVEKYQEEADKLAENLRQSRDLYEKEREDCSDEVQSELESEILQYESYIDEDGERRQEIEALTDFSNSQIELIEELIEEAEEVEETIDNWEDDDEDDDGPDLRRLWSPVIRKFSRLEIRSLSFRHGIKDKEKEGWLKRVVSLYQKGLLKLVIPEGIEVSNRVLEDKELPSETEVYSKGGRSVSLPNRLLLNEYCGKFFRCFRTGMDDEDDKNGGGGGESGRIVGDYWEISTKNKGIYKGSGALIQKTEQSEPLHTGEGGDDEEIGVSGKGGISYEIEYMIGGEDNDEANLVNALTKLLAIREGLNLAYLLSDSQKLKQAKGLATAITGVTGFVPLVMLTAFFILTVWALGEALMDLRGLLAGKRVPLWKTKDTWTLTISALLNIGKEGKLPEGGGDDGLLYISWLKIILFMSDTIVQEYRMMDMIQMNIRRNQKSFRMRRGLYQLKLRGELDGKHVFFSLGFVERILGKSDFIYPMQITVERVY